MSEKRLLVRGANWIGDAVMSMPALFAIRKALPGHKISLLVKPWVAELFAKDPAIDEIIQYEKVHRDIRGKIRLGMELKKKGFDSVIFFQNTLHMSIISFISRIPERIGYARDMGFLLTRPVPYGAEEKKKHHRQNFLNLLKMAGIDAEPADRDPWIHLYMEERTQARTLLQDLPRPVIGLYPGAAFESSVGWPPEYFGKLALKIIKDLGGSAVIFGSKKDTEAVGEINEIVNSNIISFVGAGSRQNASLLSECDAFVSGDSGLMHMAYAVGTPVLALFGPTDPKLTGPPEGNIVIRKDLKCSPCLEPGCKKKDPVCMGDIKVSEVFESLEHLLPSKKAVFFDRDGTLCEDMNYLSNWKDLRLLNGIEEMKALKARNLMLVGASNQSGIGRGIVDEGFVKEVNRFFINEHGFHAFYYCPHLPGENCSCRKPSPGMLVRARRELGIDLRNSYMVGDKESDMLAASAVGARGIFIRNLNNNVPVSAWKAVDSLKDAVRTIIEAEKGT